MQGVDYSFSRPAPADIFAAGYRAAGRYLSPGNNPKNITADERLALHTAQLDVWFVFEWYNQRAALSGYAGGKADAQVANAKMQELGAPAGVAIYYVLEDPTRVPRAQWDAVFAYCQGVLDVGGPYRPGGYGSQALLEEAIRRELIVKGWQVGGWSAEPSAVCSLYQRTGYVLGNTCDANDIFTGDFGQWSWRPDQQPQPQPAPAPAPPEEEPVFCSYVIRDNDATVWRVGGGLEPVWVITFAEAEYIAAVLGLKFNEPHDPGATVGITDTNGDTRQVWKVSALAAEKELRIPPPGTWPNTPAAV